MDQIKHYKIQEKIGVGGMGEVFRAFDTQLERDVAIKVMHKGISANSQNVQRLVQEARAAAKLVHPNVVTIYEVGEAECGHYIVMEYVKGLPLTELISKEQDLSVSRSINITIQVLRALSLAHKNGIMHRDIKSENILITENDEAKVLDFGIAKVKANSGITVAGEVLGTVEFMAPEQMLGDGVDHRCDIYATGTILYQCLTQQIPFTGQNPVELLFKKLNEEPVVPSFYNPKVTNQLDEAVLKSIHSDKDERWITAEEMIKGLESILKNQELMKNPSWAAHDDLFEDPEHKGISEADALRSVFIGRHAEYKKMVNIFHKIPTSGGQAVMISGEAGVGKTTLARQFKSYIDHQDAWLMQGTCLYQEGMDAYLPYIDALRSFFRSDNSKFSEEERLELTNIINEKLPGLAGFTERFNTSLLTSSWNLKNATETQNSNLYEELFSLFILLSEIRPIVLVIDDLQWADEASLRLFHYLARQISNNKILLIGISRTDYFDLQKDGKPKLIVEMQARMRREGIVNELVLKRLQRDDCDELLDKSLGNTAFSDEFYQGMFKETKGNPFFVIETVKLFKEKGEIYEDNGIWIDNKINFKSEVPNRVEDIFMRRLSGLEEDDRELFQVASVIGYKFDPSLLSQVLELKKIDLLKKLQKIERDFQIIKSAERDFQFEHPMLADILYNEIPPALTREYHLLIAEEYYKNPASITGSKVGIVAQHFRKGGDNSKAIPMLHKAAERAFSMSAFRDFAVFIEDMFESIETSEDEYPDDVKGKETYYKLGVAYEETGDLDKSLSSFKTYAEMGDQNENPQMKVNALMRIGRLYDKLGQWSEAVACYEECLTLADAHGITEVYSRVYCNIGVYHFHRGSYDEALKYFRKTIRSVDSDAGLFDKAHAYTNVGIIANIVRGEYGVALENFEKALEIYEQKKSLPDQARVYHNIGMFHADHEEWLESIKAYEKCLKLVDSDDSKHLKAITYLNMAEAYARQKKLVKAKKLVEKALKLFKRMADIISIAEAYHIYGIIYGNQDNFARAEKYLRDALKIFENKEYLEGLAEAYLTYGNLCVQFNHNHVALEKLKKAKELFTSLKIDAKVKSITELIETVDSKVA